MSERRRLSLVEILVLVAMALILLSIIGPALGRAKVKSQQARSSQPAAASEAGRPQEGESFFLRP
jgi:type II secretory pathway pseudopilin PulG